MIFNCLFSHFCSNFNTNIFNDILRSCLEKTILV